jgi:hypothetical protein
MTNQTNWKEVTGVEPYVMWTYPPPKNEFVFFHNNNEHWFAALDRFSFLKGNKNDVNSFMEHKDEMIILTPQAKPLLNNVILPFSNILEDKLFITDKINDTLYIVHDGALYECTTDGESPASVSINDLADMPIYYVPEPTYPEIMKKAAQGAIDNGFNWVSRDITGYTGTVKLYEHKPELYEGAYKYNSATQGNEGEILHTYYPTLKEGECLNLHEIVKE